MSQFDLLPSRLSLMCIIRYPINCSFQVFYNRNLTEYATNKLNNLSFMFQSTSKESGCNRIYCNSPLLEPLNCKFVIAKTKVRTTQLTAFLQRRCFTTFGSITKSKIRCMVSGKGRLVNMVERVETKLYIQLLLFKISFILSCSNNTFKFSSSIHFLRNLPR